MYKGQGDHPGHEGQGEVRVPADAHVLLGKL